MTKMTDSIETQTGVKQLEGANKNPDPKKTRRTEDEQSYPSPSG